jgi:hypothetical protein
MAPRYYLAEDFGPNDMVSYSPHWVLAFARFANPITYDPTTRKSVNTDPSFAYEERDPQNPLIIDDQGDCVSLSVSADKDSHTASMQATLLDKGTKYLNELLPGDWVVAFMVYSENEMRALRKALAARTKVNTWHSGLKFVGRVHTVQKTVSVAPDGQHRSAYSLSCVAFSEFDSTVLYYPQLAYQGDSAFVSMDRFAPLISSMVRGENSDEHGALDPNRIIPKLMTSLFGLGAWSNQNSGLAPQAHGDTPKALTPNEAYIIPETMAKWFGVGNSKSKFSDLMQVLVGVQKYSAKTYTDNLCDQPNGGGLFWPDDAKTGKDGGFLCRFPLSGTFSATEIPPTTTTVWSFISAYIASPVNEGFVTLRPHINGDIFPFFTVRQTPYTSEVGLQFTLEDFQAEEGATTRRNQPQKTKKNAKKGPPPARTPVFRRMPTTRFLELPRWVVPDSIMTEASVGRSDAMRQNLVYVYGTGPGVAVDEYNQFISSPPVTDRLDIMRNGIRPYMPSVNCFLVQALMVPIDWREVMSDIVMGQHLTLSGSLATYGIRSPIAPGDNVEFQGVVYHIQGLSHTCSISAEGQRSFTTRMSLSRGSVDRGAEKGTFAERSRSLPNTKSTDSEGSYVGVTKD